MRDSFTVDMQLPIYFISVSSTIQSRKTCWYKTEAVEQVSSLVLLITVREKLNEAAMFRLIWADRSYSVTLRLPALRKPPRKKTQNKAKTKCETKEKQQHSK